jgi:hypothetical protein
MTHGSLLGDGYQSWTTQRVMEVMEDLMEDLMEGLPSRRDYVIVLFLRFWTS